MRFRRSLACAPLLALALTFGHEAEAQQASPADHALAEALFRDGRKLLAEGNVPAACAKLAESQRIAPALGTLLNLAVCHTEEGKTATAWAEFAQAMAQASHAGDQEREQFAREHAQSLEPHLSKVVLTADALPSGLEVRLDGEALGAAVFGSAIPVDPGKHTVEARAPGKRTLSLDVNVPRQVGLTTIHIPKLEDDVPAPPGPTSQPAAVAAPPPSQPEPGADHRGSSSSRTIGYVSLGVGAAGLVAGSYFGLHTFSKKADADAWCTPTACLQPGLDLYDEARTSATLSTISFAVGLAGVGIGTWLLVTSSDATVKSSAKALDLSIAPSVGRATGGMTLRGAWY